MNLLFIFNSMLLGVGLAMDAFSVSISNGLVEPDMSRRKGILIAGTFSFFQFLMPLIGWFCVRQAAGLSADFHKCIPCIALIILLYIGGSMLAEGIRDMRSGGRKSPKESASMEGDGKESAGKDRRPGAGEKVTAGKLLIQGIATSIDAFSVGFTIVDYDMRAALTAALIIAVVTFIICCIGIRIGRLLGDIVGSKASIVGGIILIAIGLEIFAGHFLG